MTSPGDAPRVAAVVLAAGRSARFGAPKLLASVAGQPVIRATVERVLASRARPVIVVTGHEGDRVFAALAGLDVRRAHNAAWSGGMATSLAAGVAAVPDECDALLVLLGDQPRVSPAAIDALVEPPDDHPIVVPRYDGQRGHPVRFARALFGELRSLAGDEGARQLIAREPARVGWLALPGLAPDDVDTPEDLARIERDALTERSGRGDDGGGPPAP